MSVFDRLVFLFTNENARFRVIEHTPEGRSDLVAGVRGTTIAQGAKAIVCAIPVDGRERYVLAVLPGDRRVDMKAVARTVGGRKGSFAQASLAEELTGCVVGAIPPVAFNSSLKLVVEFELRPIQVIQEENRAGLHQFGADSLIQFLRTAASCRHSIWLASVRDLAHAAREQALANA
jgi:Ala-tRNA(Pro) deacylase